MRALTQPLCELDAYKELCETLANGTAAFASGCMDSQKCHLISAVGEGYPLKLIITYDENKARQLCEDYRFFDKEAMVYPAKDFLFYSADVHSDLIVMQRLQVIRKLLSGERLTLVTTVNALQDRLMPPEIFRRYIMELKPGDEIDTDKFSAKLTEMGYERSSQTDYPGQYTIRGGIIDIYNVGDETPFRIELWGDEIDSIRSFDVSSQRSIETLENAYVYPASEYIMSRERLDRGIHLIDLAAKEQTERLLSEGSNSAAARLTGIVNELKETMAIGRAAVSLESYIPFFFENSVSLLDYFPFGNSLIVLDEPVKVRKEAGQVDEAFAEGMQRRLEKGYIVPGQQGSAASCLEAYDRLSGMRTLMLSTLGAGPHDIKGIRTVSLNVRGTISYRGDFKLMVSEITKWKREGYRIILICATETRAKRLSDMLLDYDLLSFYSSDEERVLSPGEVMIVKGGLHAGMLYPDIKFAILSESDIFGKERKKRRRKSTAAGESIRSFSELTVGDYLVHEFHGIGIYKGIEEIEVDGSKKDYLRMDYSDGGSLFVPVSHLETVQKYADKNAEHVKVNSLGGSDWHKTKSKVKKAVSELAEDLVRLYAARQREKGFACSPDTLWQKEFEDLFPFEETQDQLDAIHDVKSDMESGKIMDRLLCGDVGFGKTEVAIRAAFKMVQESRQCAVLVPTTVLAQQHYNTFIQRMKDYPVNISVLSRFRSRADQKRTLEGLKNGTVDIVVGTHRLLSKDVQFHDLGLLIVDEEQRFGVTHKEKIKKMKVNVDVLTLTATPIPRTMHMSMIGIRDISILNEPPVDRLPIQTFVMEEDDEMIRDAIIREYGRGGQVYFVHNRVKDIDLTAMKLHDMLPDLVIEFAHGQMGERELEDIMYRFINGEIDVLVSTTIIETGLDIPNVNTLIVQDADRMGLSQLYQLRGRVGRSNRTAYAFLMYRRDKVLREVAEKRLSAIRQFTDLGSGYRIAMKDLEIRGAGDLLGRTQSGHMASVGYDLYCKLLGEAVKAAKGENPQEDFETIIDINIDAYIPASYIKNESRKLEFYKKIAAIDGEGAYSDLIDEFIDRYGSLPRQVSNLLMIALIKAYAHDVWAVRISQKPHSAEIVMHERAQVNVAAIPVFMSGHNGRIKFISTGKNPYFTVEMKGVQRTRFLDEIREIIMDMKKTLI